MIRIKQLRQISSRRNHRGHSRLNPKERGRNSTRNRGASPAGIEEHISRRVFRKPPVVGHRHPKDSLCDRRTRQRRERTYRSLLLFIGISVANPPIRRDHAGDHDSKRSSTSWSEQSDEEEDPNEGGSNARWPLMPSCRTGEEAKEPLQSVEPTEGEHRKQLDADAARRVSRHGSPAAACSEARMRKGPLNGCREY